MSFNSSVDPNFGKNLEVGRTTFMNPTEYELNCTESDKCRGIYEISDKNLYKRLLGQNLISVTQLPLLKQRYKKVFGENSACQHQM